MELKRLVKYLLVNNQFVSIPTVGSFVVTKKPASLSADGKSFLPPQEVITFDVFRTFNDEALEKLLVEQHNADKEAAQKMVAEFAAQVKKQLKDGDEIHFEGVGFLKNDEHGNPIFTAESDDKRISSAFGLEQMEVKQVVKETSSKPAPSTTIKTKSKSGSKTALIVVLGIVAVILGAALALYFLYPVSQFWDKETPVIAQTESTKIEPTEVTTAIDSVYTESTDTIAQESLDNTEQEDPNLVVETDKKSALYYSEPTVQESKTYYIISGSFSSLKNAQAHVEKLVEKGYKPEILQTNGSYRVAMVKYSNRNRALQELERLRREKPYHSVWLLGL